MLLILFDVFTNYLKHCTKAEMVLMLLTSPTFGISELDCVLTQLEPQCLHTIYGPSV